MHLLSDGWSLTLGVLAQRELKALRSLRWYDSLKLCHSSGLGRWHLEIDMDVARDIFNLDFASIIILDTYFANDRIQLSLRSLAYFNSKSICY
jgi:hypothetical protein